MKNFKPENSSFMQGLTESYLADLGRVIAAWSHVEQQFSILFLSVVVMKAPSGSLSNPRVKEMMGLTFDRQLQAFRARLDELDVEESLRVEARRTLDRLLTLRRQRDEVAHSVFQPSIKLHGAGVVVSPNESTALYKSWKNSKPHVFKVVEQGKLKELFDKIHALYWELFELGLDLALRSHKERPPTI